MFLLKQKSHRMLLQHDEKVGHIFVPNQKARLTNEKTGYYVVTNNQGFRSDFDFKKEKSSKPRILMFGDSYTAGDNCDNRDRFSDRAGNISGAEVYNFGVSGTGTDQHLLIFREFAKNIQADMIAVCVQVDSIRRIQVSHRKSVDRATGRQVMVPKPYFLLENGSLKLNNVPVPRERPEIKNDRESESGFQDRVFSWYRKSGGMKKIRDIIRGNFSKAQSDIYRMSGLQPYPDFKDTESDGWKLMKAILETFIAEVKPLPVLIIPIPTYEFYLHGVKPVYQPLFESLANEKNKVFCLDVTTPFTALPWEKRQELTYKIGGHFTPLANNIVATAIADFIKKKQIIETPGKNTGKTTVNTAVPPFKAKNNKYILGISCFYHNSAAALIKNGKIVAAAEEERFSRIKNDRGFPHNAVNYCLEEAGINTEHLDAVVYYDNTALTFERITHSLYSAGKNAEKMWMHILPPWLQYKLHIPSLIKRYLNYDGEILQGCHHRSHAASAFFPSPCKKAAILTLDGVGEWGTAAIGKGTGNNLNIMKEMRFPNSLGLLYSAFTEFTGFKVNSGEYKMMGLAPYGRPEYVNDILTNIVDIKDDGSIKLNMEYFSFIDDLKMTSDKFAELFGGPARKQETKITRREMDIARSIQGVTEEAILKMAATAYKMTGEKYLCMAGGVALNCVANGRVLRESPFENIWIQPAAGDSGCAVGTALDAYYEYFGSSREILPDGLPVQKGSYWGPEFTDNEIKAYLDTHGFPYKYFNSPERAEYLADEMDKGKIIGHFSGRLEYGPRALGARSITGDARKTSMQVDMNLKIKYRESFRPFAPSVLRENAPDYFEIKEESPYMLLVAPIKKERRIETKPVTGEDMLPVVRQARSDIPAVTHIDYSARVQTVKKEHNRTYYELIKAFKEKTGCPVIVNTSFNVRGEPIVCTPADAYRCFMRTEMNILALGNFILLKEDQPDWPEGKGEGLENSIKNDDNNLSAYPPDFIKKLRKIFRNDFPATRGRIIEAGEIKIERPAGNSTWEDFSEPENIKKIFEFPEALKSGSACPEDLTTAVTRAWNYTEAAKISYPLILKLIKLGMKYPINYTLEEKVPESVYAMF